MVSISMPKQHELTMCKLYALKHLKFNTKTKIKTLFCLILNKFQTYSLVSSKPSPLTIFSKCLSTFLAQYNMFLDILSLKKFYFELNSGWNYRLTAFNLPEVRVFVITDRTFFHSSSFSTVISLSMGSTRKESMTFSIKTGKTKRIKSD